MPKFNVLDENDNVVNTILSSEDFLISQGCKYIQIEEVEVPTPVVRILPTIAFKLRFTSAERVDINKSTDHTIIDFLSLINDVRLTEVDLDSDIVIEGLTKLVELGIITEARKAEILS